MPQEERLRCSPRGSGPVPFGEDLPEEGEGEDERIAMCDPALTAQDVRRSPFVARCLALAKCVGTGREVTLTGVMRSAEARTAYRELRLVAHSYDLRKLHPVEQEEVRADPLGCAGSSNRSSTGCAAQQMCPSWATCGRRVSTPAS